MVKRFMLALKRSTLINCPPQIIYKWFSRFTEKYKSWHKDHVTAKFVKGKTFEKGSILYTEEYLNGQLERLSFKVTKNVKNRLIEYSMLFPHSIICSGGSFVITPHKHGSVFTATLSFRFGYILSKIMSGRYIALKKHMREEGENLKKLLEKKGKTS